MGLKWGTFTCVGWQGTLYDPIWQVTHPRSRVRVCTVNSFFSRRTKSEKQKTAVFCFPSAVRKSTHGFPYHFSHFCRTRKTKNELCIAFSTCIANTKIETRCAKYFSCHIQYGMRKTKNGPLCCFSHFLRYRENEKQHLGPFFLIPRAQRKTKYGNTVRISFFEFLTAYGMRKTSGATVVFSSFAWLNRAGNEECGKWNVTYFVFCFPCYPRTCVRHLTFWQVEV